MSSSGSANKPVGSEVLTELSKRYYKCKTRNQSYIQLVTFICFVSLLLTTLYLQRNAHLSYQIYDTVASGLLPDPTAIATSNDVYSWLNDLLHRVWQDPICGDGVCEVPFEFAQYGRFGCRADCGRLQDIQNLTMIQIDMYYDFNHPSASIPATELMTQAAWNLCPERGKGGCYWAEDQRFDRLSGSFSQTLEDVPDGDWALIIKRDIFNKVSGAVRILPALLQQAVHDKVTIAFEAARMCKASEEAALHEALDLAQEDLVMLLNVTLQQQYEDELDDLSARLASGALDAAAYTAYLATINGSFQFHLAQLQLVTEHCPLPLQPDLDMSITDECVDALQHFGNLTTDSKQNQLNAMRQVVNLRLVPLQSIINNVITAKLQELLEARPEVHAVISNAVGQDPALPKEASVVTLARHYIEGPGNTHPLAKMALSSRMIAASDITVEDLATRVQARVEEMATAYDRVLTLPEVQAALAASGVDYNYASWNGGKDAYMTCNLQSRIPGNVGLCSMYNPCNSSDEVDSSSVIQIKYSCDDNKLDNNECGDECDRQQLCSALCTCENACPAEQICMCPACMQVPSARTDSEFLAMEAFISASSAQAAVNFLIAHKSSRRHLLASNAASTSVLQQILSAIETLEGSQSSLQQHVEQLESQISAINVAQADDALEELITTGQQQISVGQSRIQSMLSEIIGKQNAAATSQAATVQALANLQSLQQQQLRAQQQLEHATRDRIAAIEGALQQNLISLSQALEMYRQARLINLVSMKSALLATEPCTSQVLQEHEFTVDQYRELVLDTSRVRQLGLTNRVLGGVLLFTQRDSVGACQGSRFQYLSNKCDGGLALEPYGVDPVFKIGTSLYDPDLDDNEVVISYYNCSSISEPTYNLTEKLNDESQRIINPQPYCSELFNPRKLPYGFHHYELGRLGKGFPAVLDINLSQDDVLSWLQFLEEGLYLDSLTRSLLAQVVTYNTDLQIFSFSNVLFDFSSSGSVQVSFKIKTVRVEFYISSTDKLRLALELILLLSIAFLAYIELRGLYLATKLHRNPLSYFTDAWHVVNFCSTAILCVTVILWVAVLIAGSQVRINLRYPVYADLNAQAAYYTLAEGGTGLQQMQSDFGTLQDLTDLLSWYFAINGISLLLLICRMLQLMDFQPRLGVVTRSLAHAGPDLLHFCLVFTLVFVGYAMLAHLIFGSSVEGFSSFGDSVNTCFAILLGDIEVTSDLRSLTGIQAIAGALFFWSYAILVFLILLNFLLAIIVDAFGEIKSRTTDTTGIQTELMQVVAHIYHMLRDRIRGLHVDNRTLENLLQEWKTHAGARDSGNEDGGDQHGDTKQLVIAGEAFTEDQLKVILQGCLLDSCASEPDIESPEVSPRKPPPGCNPLKVAVRSQPETSAPDVKELAHYLMVRFGEPGNVASATNPAGDHSGTPDSQDRCTGDFSIAAAPGRRTPGICPAYPAGVDSVSPVGRAGRNGQELAGRIRADTEVRDLQGSLDMLLQLQKNLQSSQQQILQLQQQLLVRQQAPMQQNSSPMENRPVQDQQNQAQQPRLTGAGLPVACQHRYPSTSLLTRSSSEAESVE